MLLAPVTTDKGVRKSCETALSRELLNRSVSMSNLTCVGLGFEISAFQCQRNKNSKCLQEMQLFNVYGLRRVGSDDSKNAECPARCRKRQIDAFRTRQRGGSPSCRLSMLQNPFGNRLFVNAQGKTTVVCCCGDQPPSGRRAEGSLATRPRQP